MKIFIPENFNNIMKILLLDTNVYGWGLENSKIKEFLEELGKEKIKEKPKIQVLGCDIVLNEIRKIKDRKLRMNMGSLYESTVSGSISISDKIRELANEYFNKCKIRKAKVTIEDCEIIASASIAGIHTIVTDNRKTMGNPKALEVYKIINKQKQLKLPEIIGSRDAIRRFFS